MNACPYKCPLIGETQEVRDKTKIPLKEPYEILAKQLSKLCFHSQKIHFYLPHWTYANHVNSEHQSKTVYWSYKRSFLSIAYVNTTSSDLDTSIRYFAKGTNGIDQSEERCEDLNHSDLSRHVTTQLNEYFELGGGCYIIKEQPEPYSRMYILFHYKDILITVLHFWDRWKLLVDKSWSSTNFLLFVKRIKWIHFYTCLTSVFQACDAKFVSNDMIGEVCNFIV